MHKNIGRLKEDEFVLAINGKKAKILGSICMDSCMIDVTEIENVEITNDKYIITVRLISRYLDYIMDKNSGKVISGDTYERVEKTNILTFEKSRNAEKQSKVRFCQNCGHPMDVNKTGYCEFCHSTYNQENYDWVLTNIETYR